jgi:fermentation-respiration switch protein FrsA (DUF1100 family)
MTQAGMISLAVRKRIMNWLILLAVAYVVICLIVVWREPNLVYFPSRDIHTTPDETGLRFEDVWLDTVDGVRINGWYIPAAAPRPTPFTILFFHGNAGNMADRFEKTQMLRALGVDFFTIDYRGYGRSEGSPNEQGTYRDAQAAYDYLTQTQKRDPKTIILYGESLGSAIAVDLATKKTVAGVIIEEPFTSAADVGRKMFPYLPVQLLVRNKYDTLSKIAGLHVPILILHSREDEFFAMRHAERLLAAAPEPKRLVELRGSHNDAFLVSGETYRTALKEFVSQLPVNK